MVFSALAPAALAVGVPGRSTPRDHGVVRVNYIRPSHKRRVFSSSASSCTAVPSRRVGVGVGMSHGRALVGTSTTRIVRLAAISSDGAGDFQSGESDDSLNKRNASSDSPIKFAGAPMDPGSSHGQMLAHVLSNETHLFAAAVEATLDKLTEEIDSEEQREGAVDVEGGAGDGAKKDASSGLVLFKRIQQMRQIERRNAVQDVMYASILQKFRTLEVDMLPPIDDAALPLKGVDLTQLTNGAHSVEALGMVKEHLMGMLGPQASSAFSNTLIRTSKLQAAQMYAASIMFGYFLRKADRRFSLDRAMGTVPPTPADSAKNLEALFAGASAMDSMDEVDAAGFKPGGGEFPGMFGGETGRTDGAKRPETSTYLRFPRPGTLFAHTRPAKGRLLPLPIVRP